MRLHAALFATLALAVAGCADSPPPPAPEPVAVAPAPPPAPVVAKRCTAPRRFDNSGFHVRMTASNDGTCSAEASFVGNGRRARTDRTVYTDGSVTTQPKHGTVKLRFEPTDSFIDYTPTPGFVGKDSFAVNLIPGARPWSVAVTVVKP